jgi:hypothetical protein
MQKLFGFLVGAVFGLVIGYVVSVYLGLDALFSNSKLGVLIGDNLGIACLISSITGGVIGFFAIKNQPSRTK